MPGWREETGVATRIALGERRANDGRTGLVSGLWYPLDVIDGEPRENRRGARRLLGVCACVQGVPPLSVHVFDFISKT